MCSKNVTKVEQFCYNFDHAVYEKMHSYCQGNRSLFVGMIESVFMQSRLHRKLISFQINCLFDIFCNLSNPLSAESPIIL